MWSIGLLNVSFISFARPVFIERVAQALRRLQRNLEFVLEP
jgi:hypothetical protein